MTILKLITISFCILLQPCFTGLHDVNMSFSNLYLKDDKLQLKIKFFTDDLQSTLTVFTKGPVDLINKPIQLQQHNIIRYVEPRLTILVNGVLVKWKFKKNQLSSDVIFVEFESVSKYGTSIKKLEVKDILFFEDFPEQNNLINCNIYGKQEIVSFKNGSDLGFKQITYQ